MHLLPSTVGASPSSFVMAFLGHVSTQSPHWIHSLVLIKALPIFVFCFSFKVSLFKAPVGHT